MKKTKKVAFQIYDVCVSRDLRYLPNVSCILKGIQSYVCSKRCKKEHTELFCNPIFSRLVQVGLGFQGIPSKYASVSIQF